MKPRVPKTQKKKDIIFYICMLILPVSQFIIFYVAVNFNYFSMAFTRYTYELGAGGSYKWAAFENFSRLFSELSKSTAIRQSFVNSIKVYFILLPIATPLTIFFSYYIFKRFIFHRTVKVMLFVPAIVSSVIMVMLFKYFVEDVVPVVLKRVFGKETEGLLANVKTRLPTLMFYSVFVSFGTGMLMYFSAMEGISTSILEAARLDGAKPMQEFIRVIFPMVYPTFVAFIIIGIANIFTNQISAFNFYYYSADTSVSTVGYYLFRNAERMNYAEYPYLAAVGLFCTLFIVPLALLVRKALEKWGPSA